ncbi:hypothetical protein PhCBS80983_g03729 [Powellomyces hirtus]|uniref:Lethal giant larvae (Lgl)-like C-terminal domain-containing protein n=1 Tax=Powellomyces hirtus TaxID=109895 RepID=A0A507E2J8_9FUNG|nr:hypothetical protein PhCBS80983_g03729 [Powellomyces hirtus]
MDFFKKILRSESVSHKSRLHDSFALTDVFQLGTHGSSTSVAYDNAQSLLAVGNDEGRIMVIGNQWESVLSIPESLAAIRILQFKVGDKFLLALNEENALFAWNLQTSCLHFPPLKVPEAVTSLEAPLGTSGIYLGLVTGRTIVVDVTSGQVSSYEIPCQIGEHEPQPQGAERLIAVVALQTSPVDENLLLIGYQHGIIVMWDLKERVSRRKFGFSEKPHVTGFLESVFWHPDGQSFAGCAAQLTAFWEIKDGWLDGLKKNALNKPLRQLPRSPCPDQNDKIASGMMMFRDPKGAICLLIPADGEMRVIPFDHKLRPGTTPDVIKITENARESLVIRDQFLLRITHDGRIAASDMSSPSSTLYISPSLEIGAGSGITNVVAADCSEYLGWEMRNLSKNCGLAALPLQGGTIINKNGKQTWDVLCTVHDNKTLSFWQLSTPPIFLFKLPLCEDPVNVNDVKVWMDLEQRILLLAVDASVRMYKWFSSSEAKSAKHSWNTGEDVDELIMKMDAAVDDALRLSEEISKMARPDGTMENDSIEKNSCHEDAMQSTPPPLPSRDELESMAPPLPARHSISSEDAAGDVEESGGSEVQCQSSHRTSSDPGNASINSVPTRELVTSDDHQSVTPDSSSDSPLLPYREERDIHPTVETEFELEISEFGGWQSIQQVNHPDPIQYMVSAPWTDLVVTVTKGTQLNVTCAGISDYIQGCSGLTGVVNGQPQNIKEEIALLHVADTYYNKAVIHEGFGEPQHPVFVTVLDDNGRTVRQARPKQTTVPPDNFVILALSGSVRVFLSAPGCELEVLAKYQCPEHVVTAGLCYIEGDAVLVLITDCGTVQVLELPGLKLLWTASLPLDSFDERRLKKTFLTKDGRLIIWSAEHEFRVFCIGSDTSRQFRLYELTKAMDYARMHGIRTPSATTRTGRDTLFRQGSSSQAVATGASASGSPFGQAKQALDERGEKLGQLENKFSDLADSSKSFLDTIKEYNERQEKKKWYNGVGIRIGNSSPLTLILHYQGGSFDQNMEIACYACDV